MLDVLSTELISQEFTVAQKGAGGKDEDGGDAVYLGQLLRDFPPPSSVDFTTKPLK